MKRAALLYCVAVAVARYKLLKQRGQLPQLTGFEPDESGELRSDFTIEDAIKLRTLLDLIGNDGSAEYPHPGLAPSYAVNVIDNCFYGDTRTLLSADGPDQWIGVAVAEVNASAGSEDGIMRISSWFTGTLADLAPWIAENGGDSAVRIMLVNVSRARRFVCDRAEALGLPEAE